MKLASPFSTGGEDFVPVTHSQVALSSSTTTIDVVLEVIDDILYEGELPESFGVQLSLLMGDNAQRVTIQPSLLEILIEDNDPRPGLHSFKYKNN